MPFRAKWIDMFYHVATGSRKIRNFFTPVGALFYLLLIFCFIIIALKVDQLFGLTDLFPRLVQTIFALPILLTALFLIGWSVLHFLKSRGTPVPFNPPPRLVESGPYAHTRNPMLTGVFLLLFGVGACLGSVSLVLVFTPLFIFMNYWELKAIEEPELIRRLGPKYVEYRERTPMFFPGVRKIFPGKK